MPQYAILLYAPAPADWMQMPPEELEAHDRYAAQIEEQDRSAWDQAAIDEGHKLVVGALRGGNPGRFGLQAAIAALHATAPSYAETDWPQVLALYDELYRVWPSPVVELNRAVAVAMVRGPEAALGEVELTDNEAERAFLSGRLAESSSRRVDP